MRANSEQKVALITGAGNGLGRAMSEALASAGFALVLADVDATGLEQTAASCRKLGAPVATVEADIAEDKCLEDIVATGRRAFGQIDVLINNAGIGPSNIRQDFTEHPIRFWELTPAIFRRFFSVNCISACILSTLVIGEMRERRWGRIINITTSLDSMLRMAPYGITKAGLEAYTAVMADDLTGSGVTANVLVPGGSTATSKAMIGIDLDKIRDQLLQPDIMSVPIAWLCSDAADHVSGQRFVAASWDLSLPPAHADALASAPVAWLGYGDRARAPAVIANPRTRYGAQ